jgi:hypothetical protein
VLSSFSSYDIFWVFGTDVMVTVAKSFGTCVAVIFVFVLSSSPSSCTSLDAPIKLVFPRNVFAHTFEFSMLGLGDIVIPGGWCSLFFGSTSLTFQYNKQTPYQECLWRCCCAMIGRSAVSVARMLLRSSTGASCHMWLDWYASLRIL